MDRFCPDICVILVGMEQDALFAKPFWIKTLRKVAGPLADPRGHAAFSAFLEDLDGWHITEPDRRTVYAYCNGVILANLCVREAREFLDMLAPDYTAAMAFSEALNTAYICPPRDARILTWRVAQSKSFLTAMEAVVDALSRHQMLPQTREQFDSFCAMAFCAGVLDKFAHAALAENIVTRARLREYFIEPHLFSLVAGRVSNGEWFEQPTPLLRFVGSCYPETPLERQVLLELLNRFYPDVIDDSGSISGRRLFASSLRAGLQMAQQQPHMLHRLLQEIEASDMPGYVQHLGQLFRDTFASVTPPDDDPEDVWIGTNHIISSACPDLDPHDDGPARMLHRGLYVQQVLDTAFWVGLYLANPKVFHDFGAD